MENRVGKASVYGVASRAGKPALPDTPLQRRGSAKLRQERHVYSRVSQNIYKLR